MAEAVGELSRFLEKPTDQHWKAAKRVLRFLSRTQQLGLTFGSDGTSDRVLSGWADANWGGDLETRRSTTGYLFKVGPSIITWKSQRQATVALSTAEAEYMALCAATQEAVWLRNLLADFGFPQAGPTMIMDDNQACIGLVKNPVISTRSKHIDLKYHYVKERYE